jgi:hypothetical protein
MLNGVQEIREVAGCVSGAHLGHENQIIRFSGCLHSGSPEKDRHRCAAPGQLAFIYRNTAENERRNGESSRRTAPGVRLPGCSGNRTPVGRGRRRRTGGACERVVAAGVGHGERGHEAPEVSAVLATAMFACVGR